MTLLRGIGRVDPRGRIGLRRNYLFQLGFEPDTEVGLAVVRIVKSTREPYLILHRPDQEIRSSALQTLVYRCSCRIDGEGCIVLSDKVMAESGFEPGLSVELKLAGFTKAPWLAIRNKGQRGMTTLQEKMGRRHEKKHKTMPFGY